MFRLPFGAKVWLALVSLYIVWGSTYLAIRVGIETMPPLLMAGVRFLIAGAIMYAIGIRRGDRADRPTRAHWVAAAVIGTALCLGGNGLVTIAERRPGLASGTAALIVATVPLWVGLLEWIAFRARLPRAALIGLLGGFAGTSLLLLPQSGEGAVDRVGAATVLAAAAIWAAGSLYARRASLPARPVVSAGMEMIAGGIAILLVGLAGGETSQLHVGDISQSSALALGYLVVFGSIVGFSSYVWLLRNVRTSIATTYAYVNPLVAVLLGFAILDEPLTRTTAIAGAVIVASVAVIVRSSGGAASAQAVAPPEERTDAEEVVT